MGDVRVVNQTHNSCLMENFLTFLWSSLKASGDFVYGIGLKFNKSEALYETDKLNTFKRAFLRISAICKISDSSWVYNEARGLGVITTDVAFF